MSRQSRTSQGLPFLRRLAITITSGLTTLAIVVLIGVAWAVWAFNGAGPQARTGESTTVMLRQGAGLSEIASSLQSSGVVRSAAVFVVAAQATGAARTLKAGEYEFPTRASMAAILEKIRNGRVVRHFVTIPEGLTSEMAVEILMAEPILMGSAPVPAEGSLLPETYEVQRGEDRAAVLKRMVDAQDALLRQLWDQRQQGLPFTTLEEAITLASIVEKETGKPEERPRVAAVFVNRLRKGMRLQSDPTIIYGVSRGRPLGRGIRMSELTAPTPYNTYVINGLPPTPIANPGRAALAAVLDPPNTQEIYFVADGSGGHAFASNLAEHQQNVARWRALERGAKTEAADDLPVVEDLPPEAAAESVSPTTKGR